MPSNRVALVRPCHAPLPWAPPELLRVGYLTQRSCLRTVPGNQSQSTKAGFRALAAQGTIGSPPADMPLNSHQIFKRGRWWPPFQVARFRTTPHALGTPRPGDARALIISGKRKVPREDRTQPASPYMCRCTGLSGGYVSAASLLEKL